MSSILGSNLYLKVFSLFGCALFRFTNQTTNAKIFDITFELSIIRAGMPSSILKSRKRVTSGYSMFITYNAFFFAFWARMSLKNNDHPGNRIRLLMICHFTALIVV